MRIGIDCDGVLRDLIGSVKSSIKKKHPDKYKELKEPDGWTFSQWMPFWNEDDCEDYIFEEEHKDIFGLANAYQDALDSWQELSGWAKLNDYKLVLVSTQRDNCIGITNSWLSENGFDFCEIHYTKDKWNIDVDVLVDDSPTKLKAFKEKSINCGIPICFKRSWNKSVQDDYICIDSILDIKGIIDE